ncbi:hypothetical protein DFJ74DRAFT_713528 [Hyaloraphidium curvatum]|nr:hypothetical protein DFJ74DRAFT_713528 [Hyaloraphidium curvatum]
MELLKRLGGAFVERLGGTAACSPNKADSWQVWYPLHGGCPLADRAGMLGALLYDDSGSVLPPDAIREVLSVDTAARGLFRTRGDVLRFLVAYLVEARRRMPDARFLSRRDSDDASTRLGITTIYEGWQLIGAAVGGTNDGGANDEPLDDAERDRLLDGIAFLVIVNSDEDDSFKLADLGGCGDRGRIGGWSVARLAGARGGESITDEESRIRDTESAEDDLSGGENGGWSTVPSNV